MKSFLSLYEENEKPKKPVVMAFGRMNPPTTGHLKLIDKVKSIADKEKADHKIIVSHSQDSKKNPLSAEQKLKHAKRYSPGTHFEASDKSSPTIMHHAAKLHAAGHDHLIVVAGSDRVKEYHDLLHKYNGKTAGHGHYNFKKIEVRSAGHRDPDAEGAEGMSATKMREHAKNKDFHSFRQGVPGHVSDEHAKELMHDVRKGMGLHEDVNHGLFKAIFVTGGPGSGKDIVIRECIAESKSVEFNTNQMMKYLNDKTSLAESSDDYRREAIRNRYPLIINGPADDDKILQIKEELEELGYETLMVFVGTTDATSKERNSKLIKMVNESVRFDRWKKSQASRDMFFEEFKYCGAIQNDSLDTIEEDITDVYNFCNYFLDKKLESETAKTWMVENKKLDIKTYFVENYKSKLKLKADGPDDVTPTNQGTNPNTNDIKFGDNKKLKTMTFRTYSESGPTMKINPIPKEPNFNMDNDKAKAKKSKWNTQASGAVKASGIGREFDTRQQGTVYPMSGMGDVTYKEEKSFGSFRKVLGEAIDDPGGNDMGVAGVLGGAGNKEPLQTPMDKFGQAGITVKIKKKKIQEK